MVAKKSISKMFSVMLALALMLAPATSALAAPGNTTRVSVDSSGLQGNSYSMFSSISANDGQYVAFQSAASNLVAGDSNGETDIFVRDTVANTTTRVSLNSSGAQGNGGSYSASISADGHYVAFQSGASTLVDDDTNSPVYDIFVRDTWTDTTTRVSLDSSGVEGNNGSYRPSISADGQYVAFDSYASNLVDGDTNGIRDIFLRDTVWNTTTRLSVDSNGAEGIGGDSNTPSISADGFYVAFTSNTNNLVAGDTNDTWDIFVHDMTTGATKRVSVDSSGAEGNAGSYNQSISADGRYVAFDSGASNLVSGDTNGVGDIFLRDTMTNTTTRVSLDSSGIQGNSTSDRTSISSDGHYVAFRSNASNLVVGDTNGKWDIFVRDTWANTTTRVSLHSSGAQGNAGSDYPSISADGSFVTFDSYASNLVAGDTNDSWDIFVRDTGEDAISDAFTLISITLAGQGIASNIGNVTASNWTSFPGLYFEKRTDIADPTTAIGRITFTLPLDLSNPATQAFLQTLGSNMDVSTGRIAFDARTSPVFAGTGATLVMYHLPLGVTLEQLIVRDDIGTILDASTIVSGFVQDPITGDATFDAAHFTQFDIMYKLFLPLILR